METLHQQPTLEMFTEIGAAVDALATTGGIEARGEIWGIL
jgi:hypothetical protein